VDEGAINPHGRGGHMMVHPAQREDFVFDVAYKHHPRKGYLGLQDHGSPCWFQNIKLKPL
jgi:hypothetical protein